MRDEEDSATAVAVGSVGHAACRSSLARARHGGRRSGRVRLRPGRVPLVPCGDDCRDLARRADDCPLRRQVREQRRLLDLGLAPACRRLGDAAARGRRPHRLGEDRLLESGALPDARRRAAALLQGGPQRPGLVRMAHPLAGRRLQLVGARAAARRLPGPHQEQAAALGRPSALRHQP